MTDNHRLHERLMRWRDLWRHPELFVAVHGRDEARRSNKGLADAILAAPAPAPAASWEAILSSGDIGAVQKAHDLLYGLDVPAETLADGLAKAYRAFEGSIDRAEMRLGQLDLTSDDIRELLRRARGEVAGSAASAQALLDAAIGRIEAAESRELAEIRQRLLRAELPVDVQTRLNEAVSSGNLRMAKALFVGEYGLAANRRVRTLPPEWASLATDTLIDYHLQPDLAPPGVARHLARANMNLVTGALLLTLKSLPAQQPGDDSSAIDLIRLTLAFVGADADSLQIEAAPASPSNLRLFVVSGRDVQRFLPHGADGHDKALVAFMKERTGFAGSQAVARPVVVWDTFDTAEIDWPAAIPRITSRLLIDLLPLDASRPDEFVQAISRAMPVRPMLDAAAASRSVLAAFAGRRLAQVDGVAEDDGALAMFLGGLFQRLDLDVDNIDIALLQDACGGDVELLCKVLTVAGAHMGATATLQRRFDLQVMLRDGVLERAIDQRVMDHLKGKFSADFDALCSLLEAIDYLFEEAQEAGAGETMSKQALVAKLEANAASWNSTCGDIAAQAVDWLLAGGFLRSASVDAIRRNRALPYRLLQRG